ncbi:chymotrypsin inhibitor [Diachasma alloeum]|uniref:chymotrypsin inhibitor n=1 Tax=Diachasma alloeum TaxID=454923 RepID=UPI0007381DEF|nr:chymotrypsin inhibitor [Diachasma alloeum]XP_015127335.1 chymotrypsin inhibitor [Diachasma alloeum]
MSYIRLFLFLTLAMVSIVEINALCGRNERFQKCGSACPPSCANPDPGPCAQICKRGCFCRSGFMRNSKGQCTNTCP